MSFNIRKREREKEKKEPTSINYFLLSSNKSYLRSRKCVNYEIALELCLSSLSEEITWWLDYNLWGT